MLIIIAWNSVFSEAEPELAEGTDERSPQGKYQLFGQSKCYRFLFLGESTVFYYEDDPCTLLQDFKPFDLESWWGRRLYAYITNSANANSQINVRI